ncbi:MAG: tetratricopeptide repeat protein [Calditrichaeota bacterium]|nr:MAG: tetratricopeptide repeat protein [Calditrichota bacterium]
MSQIITLLSGNIPGGIVLVTLALLFTNLTLFFLSKSGLIYRRLREKYVIFNTVVIVLYGLLWFATKDAPPLKRIIILPAAVQTSRGAIQADFTLPELFYQRRTDVKRGYILHPWPWLYHTLKEDASDYPSWEAIALKMHPDVLVITHTTPEGFSVTIRHPLAGDSLRIKVKEKADYNAVARAIIQHEDWLMEWKDNPDASLNAVMHEHILKGDYETVLESLAEDSSVTARILRAKALVNRGLQKKVDYVKKQFVEEKNPDFERAKSILYPLIRERRDRAPVAYLLGRMAIREQEYENAEVYLKKALVDDPRDARVYYALSYLHTTRLEELELTDRFDVLRKAIRLDPGYTDAVYELAHMYYLNSSGVASSSGIQSAFNVLNAFLKIRDKDPQILSLMANIDIRLFRLDEAERIYKSLLERFPEDSNSWYNMGILYFSRKNYDKAREYFQKAIAMDDNHDAWLYLGIVYERMGMYEDALRCYRERVRRKEGDDDRYAREAMKGIRKILQKLQAGADSLNGTKG